MKITIKIDILDFYDRCNISSGNFRYYGMTKNNSLCTNLYMGYMFFDPMIWSLNRSIISNTNNLFKLNNIKYSV